ncbi:uncharacterized protein DUF3775 [Orenia metallireducens]|uniref:Uncharacterized protein n=1 Tax=Orenia metallireducens TaxID=1413210 RepID=A0A285HXV0_9FIRM|nr:DUF3775 domain-containing protein [Orenia metallireducens]PRX29264.1 uncharacterized protein DUF3775 [Orenia metallireducens]SNY40529.1 Protein of unknown function [Orenia metallireducens]
MYYEKFIDLKPKIFDVVKLAKEYMRDYDALEKEYESKKDVDFMEEFDAFHDIESKQKLRNYLKSLTNDEIMILQTVMYIGRDERRKILESNFNYIFKQKFEVLGFELGKEIDRSAEISMMMSKSPLARYLIEGIGKLSYE